MITLTLVISLIVGLVSWYFIKRRNKLEGKTPPGNKEITLIKLYSLYFYNNHC